MAGYHDLDIYKQSRELAVQVHAMTLRLPKFETYEEGSQIRRSSKSVSVSIVEGYNRRIYPRDYIKHLVYAHTECDETIIHLDFLYDTKSLVDGEVYRFLKNNYVVLSKKINNFISRISSDLNHRG